MLTGLLDGFPLWSIFPLTLAIGLGSIEIGCRIARYRRRRNENHVEAPVAPVVGATLGLLAFMTAFTFGLASTRFEERRQSVLLESNAISSSYLRAAMLPEPMSTESRNLLREYVNVRIEGANRAKIKQAIARSVELHALLWSQAVSAAQKERSPMTSMFMQSLNDVINLHEKRVNAGLYNRVPGPIWLGLYVLLILAMAVTGYHEGIGGTRRSLAVFLLVIAFASALFLITDLDRPGQGMLEVNQQAMMDLRDSMAKNSGQP